MRIIARATLIAFSGRHPKTKASLQHWVRLAAAASWQSPQDAVVVFSKAKALNGERVRFEVAGGLIVAFDFGRQIAFVEFVGTHADDDRVNALTVSQF